MPLCKVGPSLAHSPTAIVDCRKSWLRFCYNEEAEVRVNCSDSGWSEMQAQHIKKKVILCVLAREEVAMNRWSTMQRKCIGSFVCRSEPFECTSCILSHCVGK